MGFAIILVMFCHMDVALDHNGIVTTFLARTLHFFTVGVDIFLFLSGVGLYYSYTKKNQSYGEFEKKRLARILPYYFVIGGVTYLLYDIIMNHFTAGKFLSDLLFVTWFRDGSTRYWYIIAIVVFYLLFPALYRFIHGGRYGLTKTIFFSIFWWALIEILCDLIPALVPFRIALSRIPVFVIGVYFGRLSYQKIEIDKRTIVALLLGGYVLFVALKTPILKPIADYLYYPVRAMLAISIMATVIIVMEIAEKKTPGINSGVVKLLVWFGGLTLELYLLHQSYMILFEYPYKITTYPIVAFLLPTITACVIYIVRKKLKGKAT
jgi:peptidoglycan/LPS O-acetylase OafA/YrhL